MLAALLLALSWRPASPPADLADLGDALRATVTEIAARGFNRGRYPVVLTSAAARGLDAERERSDGSSVPQNVRIEIPGASDALVYVVAHDDKLDINRLAVLSRLVNGRLDPLIAWSDLGQGALDNASEVAVALQIASWAAEPWSISYRILLVGSEEQGLRGSRARLARLGPAEKARSALVINVDSVGLQGRGICLAETAGDPAWRPVALDAAAAAGLPLSQERLPGGATSDHNPLERNSIA